jgi:hypothetical protein
MTAKNVQGNSRGRILVALLTTGEMWKTKKKPSVRIVGVSAEIRPGQFPNMSEVLTLGKTCSAILDNMFVYLCRKSLLECDVYFDIVTKI